MSGANASAEQGSVDSRPWWHVWRSPLEQPPFARPVLLSIAALAAFAYAWRMGSASVEPFYGAAARSMSQSWHAFFFGSFDPAGTVSVDKLPGALWLQALSVRVFGFHLWALVLPQVIEGVLTVLVLYRAVRRLAGAHAALAAAAVLASSPITVLLGRGNVSDSLLVLLLVFAADATSAAVCSGNLRWLLLAGLWVGLAFQAKMLQAWIVLPGMAGAYLIYAPSSRWRTKLGHVVAAGVVTVVVSLSWMTIVSAVPTDDRPYVDGSRHDSVYEQVFDYNGFSRASKSQLRSAAGPAAPFLKVQAKEMTALNAATSRIGASWHRLFTGPLGRDAGWLLPAALAGAIVALRRRRRDDLAEQNDAEPLRAALVLWGGWWLLLAGFFSAGAYVNSYYLAALIPPVAALSGIGIAACGPPPWTRRVRLRVLAVVAACFAYGIYLLRTAADVPVWVLATAIVLAVLAIASLLAGGLVGTRWYDHVGRLAAVSAAVSALALPVAASASVVARGLGPFDTPFESQRVSMVTQQLGRGWTSFAESARKFSAYERDTRILFGVDTSIQAAPLIMATGREVLPIGGYNGGDPVPTLNEIQADVNNGYVRFFELPVKPRSPDPRLHWIESTCRADQREARGALEFVLFRCGS